jgi:hypothetical protein
MSTLTIAIDDEILRKAELRAGEDGISLATLIAEYLKSYASGQGGQLTAVKNVIELANKTKSGHSGPRWTREELYDRVNRPR